MSTTTNIPITVTPEAAAYVAELGLQKEFEQMLETEKRYRAADAKRLYYLSMEFLMGRSLGNNLCNLGFQNFCRAAVQNMQRATTEHAGVLLGQFHSFAENIGPIAPR